MKASFAEKLPTTQNTAEVSRFCTLVYALCVMPARQGSDCTQQGEHPVQQHYTTDRHQQSV